MTKIDRDTLLIAMVLIRENSNRGGRPVSIVDNIAWRLRVFSNVYTPTNLQKCIAQEDHLIILN